MIDLPQSPDANRTDAPRGSWWRSYFAAGGPGGAVNVKCPECGKTSTLRSTDATGAHAGHTITDDGSVSPSVVCPHVGCTWHVFVRLTGWRP